MYKQLKARLKYISPRGNEAVLEEYKNFHNLTEFIHGESTYRETEESQPDTSWQGASGFVRAKFELLRARDQKANYRTF